TESVEEDHLLPPIELAPSGSCGLLHSPESFAEPPGILGSPAWRSLDVCWLDDLVPECCSSTAQVGVDSGCAASLPFYGSIARSVGEGGRGKSHCVEKSKGGTFPLRLEIPQERRDFHFSHRPGYDGETFRFYPDQKNSL